MTAGRRSVGCGIVALVAVVAVLGYGYHVVTSSVVTAPEEVARVVAEMAWGAPVPKGYAGQYAVPVPGGRLALLVESGGDGALFVASTNAAGGGEKLEERVRRRMEEPGGEGGQRVEPLEPVQVEVGDAVVALRRFRVTGGQGPPLLRVDASLPERRGRVVLVTAYGSAAEAAVRALLAGVELPPRE